MAEAELSTTDRNETVDDVILSVFTELKDLQLDDKVVDVPPWLQNVESPFNWLPKRFSDVPSAEVIAKASQFLAMDDDKDFDSTFPFEKFIWLITIIFEYSSENKVPEANEHLKQCNQLFTEEEKNNQNVSALCKMAGALKHCLDATTAHVLWRNGKVDEAKKVAYSLVPLDKMAAGARATVEAMRAQFYQHYRSEGVVLAVRHARDALSLEPGEPLWLTLAASAIRRQRKFSASEQQVSEEEISLLERAVASHRSARHLVLLAHAYREHGDVTFKHHRSDTNFFQSQTFLDICDMQEKAFELYKEALQLKPYSEAVNRLCGYGLLKLPAFKSDYRLAERCLLLALELSPDNTMAIHSLGLYYYKSLMDYEKAALFCEKAGKLGNFSASLDMLRMKRLVYENTYDPCFDFNKLLQLYGDQRTKRHEILCQMGSYYMFFKRDLRKAMEYFKTLIDENAESTILMNHKCTFLNMACKINLLECVVNEGTLLLQGSVDNNIVGNNGDLDEIKNFLENLKKSHPDLFDRPIKVDLIDSLHKISDDIKQTYIRKKERRNSDKGKRKNSFNSQRRCSLDDRSAFSSLHKDSNMNYRRRSSGNIGDVPQYRLLRASSSKGDLGKGSNNSIDSVSKTTQEDDKSNVSSKKRYEFYKNKGYHMDSSKYRRKSVSYLSDDLQKSLFRNQMNNDFTEPILEGASSNVSETIRESCHEGEKNLTSSNKEIVTRNRYQNRLSLQYRSENRKKQMIRKTSLGEYSNRVISTNWRARDNI